MDINTSDILRLMESDDRFKHKIESIKHIFGSKLDMMSSMPTTIDPITDSDNINNINIGRDIAVNVEYMTTDIASIDNTLTKMFGIYKRNDAKGKFFDTNNNNNKNDNTFDNSTILQLPKEIGSKSPDKLMKRLAGPLLSRMLGGTNSSEIIKGIGFGSLGVALSKGLPKALPVALIVTALWNGITDGIYGWGEAEKWGVSKAEGATLAFFAGKGDGGKTNAIKNAGKFAVTGGAIGLLFGPVGTIVGGLLGGIVGGISGYLGSKKFGEMVHEVIDDFFTSTFAEKLDKQLTSIYDFFIPIKKIRTELRLDEKDKIADTKSELKSKLYGIASGLKKLDDYASYTQLLDEISNTDTIPDLTLLKEKVDDIVASTTRLLSSGDDYIDTQLKILERIKKEGTETFDVKTGKNSVVDNSALIELYTEMKDRGSTVHEVKSSVEAFNELVEGRKTAIANETKRIENEKRMILNTEKLITAISEMSTMMDTKLTTLPVSIGKEIPELVKNVYNIDKSTKVYTTPSRSSINTHRNNVLTGEN